MTQKKVLIINNEKYTNELGWSKKIEQALHTIEPVTCTIAHYAQINPAFMKETQPQYVILTGRIGHQWEENEISEEYIPKLNIIKDMDIPVLGICAGLQIIAMIFGGTIGKMIESEKDILEEGYTRLTIQKEHELLHEISDQFYCHEFHRDEVKNLPEQFEVLASSDMCRVQMVAHKNRRIYGVQFHPEWYNDEYPAGKQILTNFLNVPC